MKTADFDYPLPAELIAQEPIEPRDAARMLVLWRQSGMIEHRCFLDLPRYLQAGDAVVLNRTRVIPARVWARKLASGGKVELLLLRRLSECTWEALVRGRRVRPGSQLQIVSRSGNTDGPLAMVLAESDTGARLIEFSQPPLGKTGCASEAWLQRYGETPLPPYIHQRLDDPERYQTVFGLIPGSVAAPTAGLHFTERTLATMRELGVEIEYVTLHIGLDTFRPVQEEEVEQHTIHSEWCEITADVCQRLTHAKAEGRRIVAVGTTVVRTLETSALKAREEGAKGIFSPFSGETNLFITPGYQFAAVDILLTNFHLPRSTLLLLVSAFASRELILRAYEEAVRCRYRFFSFGDCMLIL
ncbi:MAG: tRNA preQ1(34) S-adenosylmethionine ribosyltransferase-isomerase QueA [Anaerolineae bacterium]